MGIPSLWQLAFEKAQATEKNKKLFEAYEEILRQEIANCNASAKTLEALNQKERNEQLARLVTVKLEEYSKKRGQVNDILDVVAKTVLSAKDFIDAAADLSPHVALAWAGISILLPVSISFMVSVLLAALKIKSSSNPSLHHSTMAYEVRMPLQS